MAADNVTPIYGEWLAKHLNYYVFRGENANALKKELLSINVNSSESDRALVDCYRRFVSLFVNNVYDTAFEQYEEGIMSVNGKGFLVNNQYGVWAPIGFMEENGRGGALDLEFSNSVANRKIGEKTAELKAVVKANQDQLDALESWPKSNKPSKISAYVAMTLCIAVIVCFFAYYGSITPRDFQFPLVAFWGGIALFTVMGVIKTVKEFGALRRWKQLGELKKWFGEFNAQGSPSQSILVKYKGQLEALVQNGSDFSLPKPSESLKSYFSFLDSKSAALQRILKESGKLRKKIGKMMLLFLVASLVFIVYGQNHWMFVDDWRYEVRNSGSSEAGDLAGEEASTVPVLVAENPVDVANAEASSELTNSRGHTYSISYSCDGDVNTCWQDGGTGDGTGEVLVYYFDQPRYIVGMDIINGRVDREEEYYDNNRIKSMSIYYFLDGQVTANVIVDFEDIYSIEPVYYALTDGVFDEAYYCEGVQIGIESVYAGEKYNDLCLTELYFYEGIYE